MIGSTALAAGALMGIRHALEADHLAAVATLIEEDTDWPGFVGVSWGIGHSLPIAVLGLLFVGVGVQLPKTVTNLFEVVVGSILIYLGGRMLWSISGGVHAQTHDHGHGLHTHLNLSSLSLGLTHQHIDERSFLVGIVHGFAGSGLLVIALVSAAPTVVSALFFLAAFSLVSILTMAGISIVWGRTLETALTTYLKGFAGLLSVGLGILLVMEQVTGLGVV